MVILRIGFFINFSLLLLLLIGGCNSVTNWLTEVSSWGKSTAAGAKAQISSLGETGTPAGQASTHLPETFTLAQALQKARANLQETQTVDSLQDLAGEHVENRKLLLLPDLISSLPANLTLYRPDNDPRLRYLDEAIGYNYLLNLPNHTDLVKARTPRIGQLLDFAQMALWTRLAAVREELKVEESSQLARLQTEENAILMELRLALGMSNAELEKVDYSSLAQVRPVTAKLTDLQNYAIGQRSESSGAPFSTGCLAKVHQLYGDRGAVELRLAESLFRLPRRLEILRLNEEKVNSAKIASLANAIGVALEIELDWQRLNQYFTEYQAIESGNNSSNRAESLKLIQARLAWQLAWYRLLTDLGVPILTETLQGKASAPPADAECESRLLQLLKQ